MTLKDYYKKLPQRTSPKQDFLSLVANKCGVTVTTARNWCKYGMKPREYSHMQILKELTGLEVEDLWED